MPVIALTQGMGSLAQDIAEQLAAELGIATLQHEVAERVADKMHVSKSLINRLRAGKAGTIERLTADKASIAVYTAEEVLEAAARGNVVLRGWGATCLLRTVPHVPCVRIMRPFAVADGRAGHRRRGPGRGGGPPQRPGQCGAHA
jgi:Cytidylate kinase-like family